MLTKVKSIGFVIIAAALAGIILGLQDVDWVASFGPTVGGVASLAVAWLIREPIASVQRYLAGKRGNATEIKGPG